MTKDDPKDPLNKIAEEIKSRQPQRKITKTARTLSLSEPEFTILRKYCVSKGVRVSEVMDSLIAAFLKKVEDDLPFDLKDIPE